VTAFSQAGGWAEFLDDGEKQDILIDKTFIFIKERPMQRKIRQLALLFIIILTAGVLGGCDLLYPVITVGSIGWDIGSGAYSDMNFYRYVFTLPAGGTAFDVWGTDTYKENSSIGTAAVHAGLITFAGGGTVTIRILPGLSHYTGSTRNGVASMDWGEWGRSFEFVK
jgi:hypothetical protein